MSEEPKVPVVELEKKLQYAYELTLAHLQNLKTNYGERTIRLLFGISIGFELGVWSKEHKKMYLVIVAIYVAIMALFEFFLWKIRKRAIERDMALRRIFGWCDCKRYHPNHPPKTEIVAPDKIVGSIKEEVPEAKNP